MDDGRKGVTGIMAAILASLHMETADDLFGTPQWSPRTDKLIAASIHWAKKIMEKLTAMEREAEKGPHRVVLVSRQTVSPATRPWGSSCWSPVRGKTLRMLGS
jgi:hypothetical protein